ncbi:hypothetical protein EDB80DRAFT_869615 [Ilyonectria destructans]|nr:hypothetical protein EDB80DRAFT_869615 [Ilyonectria destructans]
MNDSDATRPTVVDLQSAANMDRRSLLRQEVEKIIQNGVEDGSLWGPLGNKFSTTQTRFAFVQDLDSQSNLDSQNVLSLHELWFMYYYASKYVSSKSAERDRLAFEVLHIQAQGALSRRITATDAVETETTSDGVIWTDLPFFVSDIMSFWTEDCAGMSAVQRINFYSFLARLASVGLAKEKLCSIMLILFRDTLETPRSLGDLDANGNEDTTRSLMDLTIGDLLPAVGIWFSTAGTRIISLSNQSWHDCLDDSKAIGSLYRDDVSTNLKSSGFSVERWIDWFRRLEEIAKEANKAGKTTLSELTNEIMDDILFEVKHRDSALKSELEASGGLAQFRTKPFQDYMSAFQ